MPFVLAFARIELTRVRALLERVFNKGKPYLTFPLRRLHDGVAHQGRTSPFPGMKDRLISKTSANQYKTFNAREGTGSTYACKYMCRDVSDRAVSAVRCTMDGGENGRDGEK
jgi:hypothetical protein